MYPNVGFMISRGIDIFYWNGVPRLSQKLIGEWHSKCRTFFYRYLASLSLLEECKNWFTDETICNPTCHPGNFPIICKAYIHEKHKISSKHMKETYKATMFINYAHRIHSFISLPFPPFFYMVLNGIPNFLLFILFQN